MNQIYCSKCGQIITDRSVRVAAPLGKELFAHELCARRADLEREVTSRQEQHAKEELLRARAMH